MDTEAAFRIVKDAIKGRHPTYFQDPEADQDIAGNRINAHPGAGDYPPEVNWETVTWLDDELLERINGRLALLDPPLYAEYGEGMAYGHSVDLYRL